MFQTEGSPQFLITSPRAVLSSQYPGVPIVKQPEEVPLPDGRGIFLFAIFFDLCSFFLLLFFQFFFDEVLYETRTYSNFETTSGESFDYVGTYRIRICDCRVDLAVQSWNIC